jgi:uroporphyrinogen decarboxylase
MTRTADPLLVRALKGRSGERVPFWFMRQAGRYLPEYRALREKAGSFLELCLTPALAAEATLQPVRRFGMDAAILFSDILTVPHGLGQTVRFEDGTGPILAAIDDADGIARLDPDQVGPRLAPVYEAVRQVRAKLPGDVALIGFAGAPWTVASYMIEGGTSRDFSRIKQLAYAVPALFERLVTVLIETTAAHLIAQARAGAQVLQLFDSWMGALAEGQARRWGLEPARQIVALVKEAVPDVPVIVFPRGAGLLYEAYARDSGADAVSLDTTVPPAWARTALQPHAVVQGNLDPALLAVGGTPMQSAAEEILATLGAGRFVFNLGHGILPQTPPENLAALCDLLRSWKR